MYNAHLQDHFEFSSSEFGPGQVTNDVTLSMDMTSDTKVNIPFGPKQWRWRRHHIHHDGRRRFNVGVGRCWLSIYPPWFLSDTRSLATHYSAAAVERSVSHSLGWEQNGRRGGNRERHDEKNTERTLQNWLEFALKIPSLYHVKIPST